jgi:hypothetical protein
MFYQHSGGLARQLAQYCAVDKFLTAPALRMLERRLPARLFDVQASRSERLNGFARKVVRYDYHWRDARAIFIALNQVLNFVRVAADAEEIASEQIATELEDKAVPMENGTLEMFLDFA